MRVTLVSTGSRGDVQPYVALGAALKHAGHQVRIAIPENFGGVATAHGLEYQLMRGDWQALLQGEAGKNLMRSGANAVSAIRAIRQLMMPIIEQIADDMWAAAQGADVLLCHSPLCMFGQAVAESLCIPMISAEPIPLIPTRTVPSPMFPLQRDLGAFLNAGTTHLLRNVMFRMFSRSINQQRSAHRLPTQNARRYFRYFDQLPMLEAFSDQVFPRPADWGENVHITGYWFLEEPEWSPPQRLREFLDAGKPPIFVGFGSMSGDAPEKTTELILDGIAMSGERAVFGGGWGGIAATEAPDSVLFIDTATYSWLFPRVAAVVHHGGSGTTAAGLHAGVPTVIVPHVADQFFWGNRTYELGIGVKPIPRKSLTAENLALAIRSATDPAMRQRAADFGAKIRSEDGVGTAVRLIERIVQ